MLNLVYYSSKKNNWGDSISNFIATKISNKSVKWYHGSDVSSNEIRYTCTGSIIQWLRNKNTVIWGIGFISPVSQLHIEPKDVYSVRGPLSRNKLINAGIKCPEIYGDPALLMSRFYNPKNIQKKYHYGIIPHYVDKNNPWLNRFKGNKDVKIINIQNTEEDLKSHRFINDILECEIILSSSLHGLIAADSYNIPSYWIELSNGVIGNGFKFRDYFLSVNRPVMTPIQIQGNESIKSFSNQFYDYNIDIDLDKLLNVCPFKSNT